MKNLILAIAFILASTVGMSQIHTFNTHYVKVENGLRPEFKDAEIRTVEIKENVITVTNLFGCAYTADYTIVDRLDEHTMVVAYEAHEVIVKYSPTDKILVVTTGLGVKGHREVHIYGEQNPIMVSNP